MDEQTNSSKELDYRELVPYKNWFSPLITVKQEITTSTDSTLNITEQSGTEKIE